MYKASDVLALSETYSTSLDDIDVVDCLLLNFFTSLTFRVLDVYESDLRKFR